ncbi:hypothetical protein QMK19_08730 [Streptomyces sp. H10-C2]|uniref:hypothetical protein n=1 Tax=unclassified Streptomyces TaxID=2593676 RepID=UPI0024BA9A42|nr:MULTISPECIES: hypothetical protein [unclassified Streptomyces]MDJ0341009.1 hypothetical protein [Streptomyces sp. PH10-H1]MDJ0369759.1 hypothetical protein [Streptomyces sp. H10-C2]
MHDTVKASHVGPGRRELINELHNQKYTDALEPEKAEQAAEQKAAGVHVDVDRNWVVVKTRRSAANPPIYG